MEEVEYPARSGRLVLAGRGHVLPRFPLLSTAEYKEVCRLVEDAFTFFLARQRGTLARLAPCAVVQRIYEVKGYANCHVYPVDIAIAAATMRSMMGRVFHVNGSAWMLKREVRKRGKRTVLFFERCNQNYLQSNHHTETQSESGEATRLKKRGGRRGAERRERGETESSVEYSRIDNLNYNDRIGGI